MLVTDPATGQLQEIPPYASYGPWNGWPEPAPPVVGFGEPTAYTVAYDGFGNPVGAFPALAAILPAIGTILPGLLRSLFGRSPAAQLSGYAYPQLAGAAYYGAPDVLEGYGEPYVDPAAAYAVYPGPSAVQPVLHDGFGHPVGAFPALAAILPAVVSVLPGLLRSLFGNRPQGGVGLVPGFGSYDAANFGSCGCCRRQARQIVYDGLGNPVGSIPALASLIPAAATFFQQALPTIRQVVPRVARVVEEVLPQAHQFIQALANQPPAMPAPSPMPAVEEPPVLVEEPPVPVAPVPMDVMPLAPVPVAMPYARPLRPVRRRRRIRRP